MQSLKKIKNCYNKTADIYAEKFINELSKKTFDRVILREFAFLLQNSKPVADFGCGPGQTTKYLNNYGVEGIVGIDISPTMVAKARNIFPDIKFETANMLFLPYNSEYFYGAIAFYSIVNFNLKQVEKALHEINRVLKPGSNFLMSFHIGNDVWHLDNFLEKKVEIDFYFHQPETISELLKKAGFKVTDIIERLPYEGVEYQSKRAYLWSQKL